MKHVPAILFFIFSSFTGFSQLSIKGRVVNGATGAAIPGSSVFITNTSRGTVSNNAGYFELNNIPAGKHDLIISCVGYETNVFSFSDDQLPLQLKVELAIKIKELQNVTVEPSVEEGWDKWGRAFMDNFVGNTENATKCRIKNEQAIKFRYYRKSNRLIAYCDEPILLENKALGYIVNYQLENFEVNFSDRSLSFLGYSLFEPIDKGRQQKWKEKRQEAYNGSIMHFMRSLYANRLPEEGFEIRRAIRTPNHEKERVRRIYRGALVIQPSKAGGAPAPVTNSGVPAVINDSLDYYRGVLRQNDYTETLGNSFLTADSLIIQTSEGIKTLHFDDYLYITFKNEKEEGGYLKNQFPERRPFFQRSYVNLLNDKLIFIDKSGNFYNPQEFFTSGYWAWSEKMANSMPLDYEVNAK